MKPFFSIRIDYNPADSEDMVAFDENAVRFAIARETERHDAKSNYETWQNVASKVVSAIQWLCGTADPGDYGLLGAIFDEMRSGFPKHFLDSIKDAAEIGDDDEIDQLREAIEKGVKAANEPLAGNDP